MAFNILESIDLNERLNFSQNFAVTRPTVLDTIFPDVKTDYWKAEYYRLMSGATLPDVAFVHALDTEAEIGQRVGFEKVEAEKLFIKRKINQTESLRMAIEHGVPESDALINFAFDDASNLFEGVLARTKIMKGNVLSRGKIDVKENGVNMSIDLQLPRDNKITFGKWSSASADIMGDIQNALDVAEDEGYVINSMLTSKKNLGYIRNNEAIQAAILGVNNKRLLTKQEIANFFMTEYGLTINVCDEKYRYKKADGTYATGRYFDEDAVSFYEADANGSFGVGLWGPTPEEDEYRAFAEVTNNLFITMSMWATPDPVATWTKASGLFIPVTPKANGLVIGRVTSGE